MRRGADDLCRRMMAVCALALVPTACSVTSDRDVPARYGLVESAVGRNIVEQAITLVDFMLPADVATRLRPTWPALGWYPPLTFKTDTRDTRFRREYVTDFGFDNGLQFYNAAEIRVFIVDGAMLGQMENVFVPDGEECIVVNAASLDGLFESFFISGPAAVEQHNSFDKALLLTLILLHELGHVNYHDAGSYGTPARLDVSELNKPSAAITNPEVRADRYASEMLTRAWASHEMHAPIEGPYGAAFIASNVFRVIATGSNTFDFRRDPQGILDGIAKAEQFRQGGYSHLNLYLRLLVLLEQLEPSEARLAEIRWIADTS